jgi:hypothetical protein
VNAPLVSCRDVEKTDRSWQGVDNKAVDVP